MTRPDARRDALFRFFSGLAEYVFQSRLGVADPPLVDYVSDLLVRFVHLDTIYRLRDLAGRRIGEVTAMLVEADARVGEARRQAHRHIGDYTLFWTGVYPEAFEQMRRGTRDQLINCNEHGKRAYYIASTTPSQQDETDDAVLLRLSHEFELFQYGLRQLRETWECQDDEGEGPRPLLLN